MLTLNVKWEGPLSIEQVIRTCTDAGCKPDYAGEHYGLYAIYGKHILAGKNSLLYIGKASGQTFARRMQQHRRWLEREEDIQIYVGSIHQPKRHTAKDKWAVWEKDILLAEKIMIYKYSPHYNARSITRRPDISPHKKVKLVHKGAVPRLKEIDVAPDDF